MLKLYITAKNDIRLHELLAEHLPARSDAETVIAAGGVWVGKSMRALDPAFLVKAGATVRVYTSPQQGRFYRLADEQVIYEDEGLLVVYKPANLNVHAVPSSLYYNLNHGVGRYLKKQGSAMEPTPLTRLDRPVEGLVLFGKNKQGERLLSKLVRKGRIRKWYIGALEKGKEIQRIEISDTIMNDGSVTKKTADGKRASTRFTLVESLENADVYSIFPFTGRRHQIRFHAAAYIAPIIGDRLYGARLLLKPDEIALLCRGYNIPLKGKNLKVRVPQSYLEAFFRKLKQAQPLAP